MSGNLVILPVTPSIGAEVEGIEVGRLGKGDAERLRDALNQHLVLFLRDQENTPVERGELYPSGPVL